MSSVKWRPFCLGLNVLSETADASGLQNNGFRVQDCRVYGNCILLEISSTVSIGGR